MRHVFQCAVALAASIAVFAGPDPNEKWAELVKKPKFDLQEAIDRGLKEVGKGTMYCAELEPDKGRLIYSLDIVHDDKMTNVIIDSVTGEVVEKVVEDEDHAKLVASCKLGLKDAVAAAAKKQPGTPIYARVFARGEKVGVVLMIVADGKLHTVIVDGATGEVTVVAPKGTTGPAAPADSLAARLQREFTDRFNEDKADLVAHGANPYFMLEPGRFWVLAGKEGGKAIEVTYTVLAETKRIDGVECGILEVREVVGGELREITRDYHAFSKRTGNVYYFGEDVDVYQDGKVVAHDGAWLSGVGENRWGLMVSAVPLIGSRHYQEIAPGIARDRVEVVSLGEVVETPAGTFKNVLKQEETNPEEPGHIDYKYFSTEVGFMVKEEESLVLVRFGKK